MVASRDILKGENKLLVDLENLASSRPGGEDWANFFSQWRGINENLIGLSDSNLNQALDDEIKRLEKMRNAIAGDSTAGGQFWTDMLNLDIEGARALKV
jgi:hypothetical protein